MAGGNGYGGRRVGELARASGLTVRTLHYYEQIGLLVPSRRSDGGQRLHDDSDVARLYRICLLRRVGLPLAEIRSVLDDPTWSLSAAMGRHLTALDRRQEATARLRTRVGASTTSSRLRVSCRLGPSSCSRRRSARPVSRAIGILAPPT